MEPNTPNSTATKHATDDNMFPLVAVSEFDIFEPEHQYGNCDHCDRINRAATEHALRKPLLQSTAQMRQLQSCLLHHKTAYYRAALPTDTAAASCSLRVHLKVVSPITGEQILKSRRSRSPRRSEGTPVASQVSESSNQPAGDVRGWQQTSDRPRRLVHTALGRSMLSIWEPCGVVDSVSLPGISLVTTYALMSGSAASTQYTFPLGLERSGYWTTLAKCAFCSSAGCIISSGCHSLFANSCCCSLIPRWTHCYRAFVLR